MTKDQASLHLGDNACSPHVSVAMHLREHMLPDVVGELRAKLALALRIPPHMLLCCKVSANGKCCDSTKQARATLAEWEKKKSR